MPWPMTSLRFVRHASMLLLGCLVVAHETNAAACSQPMYPVGFVLSLDASRSELTEDDTSPVACELEGSRCGATILHEKQRRYLLIRTTVGAQEDGPRDDTFVTTAVTYVLKDAAGTELARVESDLSGARFDRLGATVCVKTHKQATTPSGEPPRPDIEAGEFEFCAPVNAGELTVSDAESKNHQDSLVELCGEDYEPSEADGSAASGCSTGRGPASLAGSAALGLPLALLLMARRRRNDRVGGCKLHGQPRSALDVR